MFELKTFDIILIMGLMGVGVLGFLYYKKEWPFDGGGSNDNEEEENIIKDLDYSGARKFISDAFERGKKYQTDEIFGRKDGISRLATTRAAADRALSSNTSKKTGTLDWILGFGCGDWRSC